MTAIDVLRDALGWAEGGDAERGAAALADLEALVEAAKVWEAAEPWGEPCQCTCNVDGCICDVENELRAALARVLGTEQDTA